MRAHREIFGVNVVSTLLVLLLAGFVHGQVSTDGPVERVLVTGEVHRPREVAFAPGLTIMRAIIVSGGYAEFGRKAVYLVRARTSTAVDMRAIVDGRSDDVPLQPWDIIVVGRTLPPRR